jgi:spore maturation protein CgeB
MQELFEGLKIPVVGWYTLWGMHLVELPKPSIASCIFTPDKKDIRLLKEKGYRSVEYLPLATNPRVFKPIKLGEDDLRKYECDLSFVGSCDFYTGFEDYQNILKKLFKPEFIEKILLLKSENPMRCIEELQKRSQKKFRIENWLEVIEFEGVKRHRKEIIEALKDFEIHLYGDKGWLNVRNQKAIYRGKVNRREELVKIYNSSKINLNIHLARNALNLRVFDISACRAFGLHSFRPDLLQLFREDEVAYFKDKKDLIGKIDFYLRNPEEREKVALRGQRRVLREHTFRDRVRTIIEVVKEVI